jgi:glycogen(starch) synthase
VSGAGAMSLSSVPRYWPDESGGTGEGRPIRRWRVLHACDMVGTTVMLAEAQVNAGMRPSVLTRAGWYRPLDEQQPPATALSLIHEWQEVRRWRQHFVNESVDNWAEVVHAHCFAAAMAAMRGAAPVVYDLVTPIGAGIVPRPGAWLLRSLRVAEQFALSRAGAVVTHSQAMWSEALQRGVSAEDLFLAPNPVEAAAFPAISGKRRGASITLFAPDATSDVAARSAVIAAFAMLLGEVEEARLRLEVAPESTQAVLELAAKAGVAHAIHMVARGERERAMEDADIVIAAAPAGAGPDEALISALAHGRAIVAADVAQNREVTPQGRGCLWYRKDDFQDLAGRAAFLARNPDFRTALGISGRGHLQATRSPKVVAAKYDDVYRHAFQRRNRGGPDAFGRLEIVRA